MNRMNNNSKNIVRWSRQAVLLKKRQPNKYFLKILADCLERQMGAFLVKNWLVMNGFTKDRWMNWSIKNDTEQSM